MPHKIEELADKIIAREGGFVDDPDDPGGATKYGVTLRTLRILGKDADGDGDIDRDDIRALTTTDARRIFVERFFEEPGLGRLPDVLQPSVFDMYVNAGRHAIRILQTLLNDFGNRLDVDGVFGPKTEAAAYHAAAVAPDHLADAYGIARRNYYYALADRRPASRKYARRRDGGKGGWILRAEEFISPRYHLSNAEHSRRVAAWA